MPAGCAVADRMSARWQSADRHPRLLAGGRTESERISCFTSIKRLFVTSHARLLWRSLHKGRWTKPLTQRFHRRRRVQGNSPREPSYDSQPPASTRFNRPSTTSASAVWSIGHERSLPSEGLLAGLTRMTLARRRRRPTSATKGQQRIGIGAHIRLPMAMNRR